MSDVFVSYKAEDRSRVAPLVAALEADGHSVWWDAHIAGGEEWRDEIADQLEAASCVIVVWSKRSIGKEGRFVRDEATRALKSGTYLPIRIDRIEPPLGFGETQALPLLGWKGDRNDPQFAAIEEAVSAKLRKERTVRPVPAGVSRRKVVVGGAVALVADEYVVLAGDEQVAVVAGEAGEVRDVDEVSDQQGIELVFLE